MIPVEVTGLETDPVRSRLPRLIPQLEDRPITWARFLYKCCTGSHKVWEMLISAEQGVMCKTAGYTIHVEKEPDVNDDKT